MAECKWIYANNEDNTSRYLLGTKGKSPILCFGINPSTAEPNATDNTIRKVAKISEHNNYDSWIMMNVFPVRATTFDNLNKELTDKEKNEHTENLKYIKDILNKYDKIDIWLAFGNHIFHRNYLSDYFVEIYEELSKHEVNWYITKENKSGAPAHPLYQKNDSKLIKFENIGNFIEKVKNK